LGLLAQQPMCRAVQMPPAPCLPTGVRTGLGLEENMTFVALHMAAHLHGLARVALVWLSAPHLAKRMCATMHAAWSILQLTVGRSPPCAASPAG
jgi:hypothetical protein